MLVSTFGLSCKEAEKGVVWLSLVHLTMLIFFIMELLQKTKKKALRLVGFYLLPWTRNGLLSLYGLLNDITMEFSDHATQLKVNAY